jgi:hypothetical protein
MLYEGAERGLPFYLHAISNILDIKNAPSVMAIKFRKKKAIFLFVFIGFQWWEVGLFDI